MATTEHDIAEQTAVPEATPPLVGNPAVIGVPTFVIGSIALGLALTGYVPATAAGATIPIILAATGIGQVIAAIWSAALAQNAVASIFAIFAGFWISYSILVIGLTHNWYGITEEDAVGSQKLFLLTWLIAVIVLTLVTLRLPLVFSVLFVLVDLALLFVFLGTANASTGLTAVGGYFVFAFTLVGVWLFASAMSEETGGKPLPMGGPLLGG